MLLGLNSWIPLRSIGFCKASHRVFHLVSKFPFSSTSLQFDIKNSMDTTTPAAAAQYNAQERVLCYHGAHVYEAKVLKTKNFDEPSPTTGEVGPHYLVHYKGWKQT